MKQSYFDGTLLQLVVYKVIGTFITTITLGFGAPWAIVLVKKWEIKHTVVDGRRLYFTGSAASLFGHWVKWLLLTIITFGIYGFWLSIKTRQWIVKNTHMM